MNTTSLKINKNDYTIKFGFAAQRILAKEWNLKTLGEIGAKIASKLTFKEGVEPTLDQFSAIGDLVMSGILSMHPDANVTSDDVVDALLQNTNKLTEIIQLYSESMPKPEKSKNVKPVKK